VSNSGIVEWRGPLSEAWTFLVIGSAAIFGAGLFSAVTARATTYHSAWLVAYLVLVVGVAQIALGLGQATIVSGPLQPWRVMSEVVLFNLGNIGVVVGTLLAIPLGVDVGSALLVASLILFGQSVRGSDRRRVAVWGYLVLVVLLVASVIVGIFFAHR